MLRPAGPADADALSLLASAAFLETYAGILAGADILAHCREKLSARAFAVALADPSFAVTLAEHPQGRALIGYMVTGPSGLPLAGASDIELLRLYVLTAWQGTGLGAVLMAHAVENTRASGRSRLLLGVYHGNARARRFYEREGFTVVGERPFRVGEVVHHDPVYALTL